MEFNAATVKEYFLSLGFAKVGIAGVEPFAGFAEEVCARGGAYQAWLDKGSLFDDPKAVFPEARSIIVLAYDYSKATYPEELTSMVGRAYLARCYRPLPESICGARLQLVRDYLEQNGVKYLDVASQIPVRQAAARAGVANFGKNNFAYVDGVGSFVMLFAYIIDKYLEPDEPTWQSKCPETCTKCVDACPTGALYAPHKLDPAKCMGYNNWMRRIEGHEWYGTTIPEEEREALGIRIHGCDLCQEACPRNQRALTGKAPADPFLEIIKDNVTLIDMLHMPEGYYERYLRPIMYNYISPIYLFQRNAAIAMGNTGDPSYVPELIRELDHPEYVVRLHCAWALGKLGGEEARAALEKRLAAEDHEAVRTEIEQALS